MGRLRIALALLVLVGAAFAARSDRWPWHRFEARAALVAPAVTPLFAQPTVVETLDTLHRGETVGALLQRHGVLGLDLARFDPARSLDPRRLRTGLVFSFRHSAPDSAPTAVRVRTSPERLVTFTRASSGWTVGAETIPWRSEAVRIEGGIDNSLYEALDAQVSDQQLDSGDRVRLAWDLADVFAWEVDFTRDIRSGDRFEVLYDRLVSGEGDIRFGRVMAVRVNVAQRPSYAFYFEPDSLQGAGGFYDDQGRSLKRAFLRAPLQFRRITSGFGGRMHPILHTYRQHEGVDYAAAYGTPVRATADGLVTLVGRDAGYGNMIELRHANGIRTRYGHLSAFMRGLHSGERIVQGETIGYVGSTGLSTGPHLHYEFLVNGRPTNPQRTNAGAGAPVPRSQQSAFAAARAALGLQLEPVQAGGAKSVD